MPAQASRFQRFPGHVKARILKRVIEDGESVAKVCRENGISRKTFYQWKKLWERASGPGKRAALRLGYRRGEDHPRSKRARFVGEILPLVVSHPTWGSRKISKRLAPRGDTLSNQSVYRLLSQLGLSTFEQREEFSRRHQQLAGKDGVKRAKRLLPFHRKQLVESVLKEGKSVREACSEYGVSRKTYYFWRNRYQNAQEQDEITLSALEDRYAKGFNHPNATPEPVVQRVLQFVVENPRLSVHRLNQKISQVGHHAIQNIYDRYGLNTYERRLAYARAQERLLPVRPLTVTAWLDRVKQVFEQFLPSRAPAPPQKAPAFRRAGPPFFNTLQRFSTPILLSISVVFGLYSWGRFLGSADALDQAIGWLFASIALSMGSVFFLYSLKYFFSLAVVLSFSREIEEGSSGQEQVKGSKIAWWKRLFAGHHSAPDFGPVIPESSRAGGLEPDLTQVDLQRRPFISVHLPMYNERRVAERVLRACTSFDYPSYEVIVADDSTDETSEIVQEFADEWNLRRSDLNSKMARSDLSRPRIKVVHRNSREGFKGGALREAMEHTDPRAEFIVVFDADFVPYPDTLELFLKYFQVNAGSLTRAGKGHSAKGKGYVGSNIAAVQGYQWHVLNKSENWITRGVRSEYAGSYVIERSGEELYGGLKQIAGSVYMIRRDLLDRFGWGTSLTEDFELTLRLYEAGYKVVYTPYIQAPAECASTLVRLIRQRMRWAEGHSFNIKKMFGRLVVSPQLKTAEKLEFLYLSPYYLQAAFFLLGTFSWMVSDAILRTTLPFWTAIWGWSLVLTNLVSLPLMNAVGLFLEEAEERDFSGILSFVFLSYVLVPFQAYAAVKGFLEFEEGPWFRTPKTGLITDVLTRARFYRFIRGIFPGRIATAAKNLPAIGLTGMDPANWTGRLVSRGAYAFRVRPKRAKKVGRGMLVGLLITAMLLNYLSFFAPQPIQAQAAQPTIEQQINIVDQEYTTTNTTASPTDNSLGMILWDGTKYSGEAVYLDAVLKCVSCTGGQQRAAIQLYTDSGSSVTNARAFSTSSSYTQVRSSGDILNNLTDGEEYTVRIFVDATSGTAYVQAARLVVVQSDSAPPGITDTQTQIEVGNNETTTNTSYTQLTDKKIYRYTSGEYSPSPSTDFEATLKSGVGNEKIEQQINILDQDYSLGDVNSWVPTDNSLGIIRWDGSKYSGETVYFEAVMKDTTIGGSCSDGARAGLYTTGGSQVSDSDIKSCTTSYGRVRSLAITLTDNTDYTVRFRNNFGSAVLHAARLIIVQNGSALVTDTESQIELGAAEKQGSSTVTQLTDKKIYQYDSTKFSPSPTAYFEASLRNVQPTIEQQVNLLDQDYTLVDTSSYQPTDHSLGIFRWDANKYSDTVTLYLDVVIKDSNLGGSCSEAARAALYTTGGSQVSGSITTVCSTSYSHRRSSSFTLTDDTDYTVRMWNAWGTAVLHSAWLTIVQTQSGGITDTSTQVEVGDEETGFTNTSYSALTDYKIYYYDQDQFSATPESSGDVEFHASLKIDDSGDTVYAELFNCGNASTCNPASGQQVAQVSHTGDTTWTLIRGTNVDGDSDWDTTNDDNYIVRIRCNDDNGGGCSGNIASAKIVLDQSDAGGLTDVELIHLQVSSLFTDTDSTYSDQDFLHPFNPDLEEVSSHQGTLLGGTFTYYFEVTLNTDNGANAAYAQLRNDEDGSVISNSEVNTSNTSYTRVRSGDITSDLPSYPSANGNGWVPGKDLDTQLKNDSSSTTSAASTWLVIQASNLATSSVTAYADLYNLTDGAQVSSSEVSTTNTTWTRVRSGSITLTTAKNYVVRLKSGVDNVPIYTANAKIIFDQTDGSGISSVETVQQYINALATDSDTGYTDQDYLNQFDPGNFEGSTFTYYFEATIKTTGDTTTAYAQLWNDTDGSAVSSSEVTTGSQSYTRARSSDITSDMPSAAKNMDTQMKNSTSATTSVSSSWLVIQVSNLIGPTETVSAALYQDGATCTTQVSGSEITLTSTSWTRVRTASSITLSDATDYMVCVKTADSSATGSIANAKIIHEQSDVGGITDVELYHTYVNTLATDADSTYTDQDFLNQFDPDNFDAGTFTYYFESTIKTSGGTGYAQLWNDTDGSAVTSSEVTTTSTSYERQRSSDISSDMPSTAKTMDTQLKGTASTTASASTSWLIIQVSSLQIPEGILYAIPVMVFFPAIVRWWRERRIAIRH